MRIKTLCVSLFALSLLTVAGMAFGADDFSVTATPVPEPGTLAAMAAGLTGFVAFHLRRK